MVSGEAQESRLDEPYFQRLYNRFRNVESSDGRSVVVSGRISEPLLSIFSRLDVPFEPVDGSVTTVDVTGMDEADIALNETTLRYSFPTRSEDVDARFLRLSPIEAVDAAQIAEGFGRLRTLDADELTTGNEYTIQDIRFEVELNTVADGTDHEVAIQVPVHATPFLNRRLTYNRSEASTVAEVCAERSPEAVVTPFAAHANAIRDALASAGISEVPVYQPGDLTGNQFETIVLSFGVAGDRRMVTPPVGNIETLYRLLTAGQNIIIVGDRETLQRNSVLTQLV